MNTKKYNVILNVCRRFLYIVVFFLASDTLEAQQLPLFSQYVMNGFIVNPSLAARDGYSSVNLTVREQWMGIKDGPKTFVLNFQSSLLRNSYISKTNHIRRKVSRPTKPTRVGIGGSLFNDNNGIIRRSGLKVDYAYHIPMGKTRDGQDHLSFGLSVIMYQHAINTDKLNYSYDDDPLYSTYDKSVFITDFSFGTSYTSDRYYVGFSMTNILRGSLIFANNGVNKRGELGHYFLSGGLNFPINKDWSIKPSGFIRSSDIMFKSIQMDLTARVFYKENYWAGLQYRTNDAISLLIGFRHDKFYIGNAFDFNISDISARSVGSYELCIAAKFGESSRRFRWLNSY